MSRCGCCGDPDAKIAPAPEGLLLHVPGGSVTQPAWYCRDHYVHCLHSSWMWVGENAQDEDEEQRLVEQEEERLGRKWDLLPARESRDDNESTASTKP